MTPFNRGTSLPLSMVTETQACLRGTSLSSIGHLTFLLNYDMELSTSTKGERERERDGGSTKACLFPKLNKSPLGNN